MFYNKKACDNGKAYSPTHGHLNSNAALPLPSLLLAQCTLFMASTSKPETREKDENEKRRGWGLYQLHPKKEKRGRKLLILFVSFVTVFQAQKGVLTLKVRS